MTFHTAVLYDLRCKRANVVIQLMQQGKMYTEKRGRKEGECLK